MASFNVTIYIAEFRQFRKSCKELTTLGQLCVPQQKCSKDIYYAAGALTCSVTLFSSFY